MAANNPPNMSVKLKNYQNVYQFCVSLKSIKPRIWRRILVPENYNFRELHLAVNNSMGWNNTHLHQFKIKNPVTGKEEVIGVKQDGLDDFFLRTIDERTTKISDYFVTPKDKAKYLYDFGATWQHEVVFQKIIPADAKKEYPICVAGKRACPREDYCSPECSDLSDSENEQESDVAYDPEKFDPKEVRFHDSE